MLGRRNANDIRGLPRPRDGDGSQERGMGLKAMVRHPIKAASGKHFKELTMAEKATLVAGMVAPPLTVGSALGAVESSQHINWLTQISEYLPGDPLLRAAFFASGLLEFSFTYGFRKSLPHSTVYNISSIGLGIAGIGLSVTGITQPHTYMHDIAAGITFGASPASIGAIGVDMAIKGEKAFGIASIAAAIVAAGSVASGLFDGHILTGITEIVSASAMGIWVTGSSMWALVTDRIRDAYGSITGQGYSVEGNERKG